MLGTAIIRVNNKISPINLQPGDRVILTHTSKKDGKIVCASFVTDKHYEGLDTAIIFDLPNGIGGALINESDTPAV